MFTLNLRAREAAQGHVESIRPAPEVHLLHAGGLENLYQIGRKIYSGAAPEGDAGFAALQKLGIKTIITVDGTKPDVETAKRFGMRYVHLPVGYDGVPTNQAVRLVKAAQKLPGPIYVHCHHGMHRGPAAAAIICTVTEGWTHAEAVAWLRVAGTATNYAGLYKSVEQFQPPTAAALKNVPDDFPEISPVSPLADTMIQVDEHFDQLKLIKKASYRQPAAQPDLQAAREALLLDELFKELIRSPSIGNRDADFFLQLKNAEDAVASLQHCLGDSALDVRKTDAAFQRVADSCVACHKAFRN